MTAPDEKPNVAGSSRSGTRKSRTTDHTYGNQAWTCRDRNLVFDHEPLIMGILNVTPDSFSDGGRFLDPTHAVEQGLRMLADGAAIIDIGGESTRPGAPPVPAQEQIRRVLPVIEGILAQQDAAISIDTTSSQVAEQAMAAGACIINDVSGLTQDPAMPAIARTTKAGIVIMHMQGTPQSMQVHPQYENCLTEICTWIETRVEKLATLGIARACMVIDPGIGFGKNLRHNLEILHDLAHCSAIGLPVLVGASRKRFIGAIGHAATPAERLPGSLASLACAVMNGAAILRVHDVPESLQAARVAAAIRQPERWAEQ